MIATSAIVRHRGHVRENIVKLAKLKHTFSSEGGAAHAQKYNNSGPIDTETSDVFGLFVAALDLTQKVIGDKNVLQVHNCDLVHDPRGTISRMFEFLEVDTTEDYLNACEEEVFIQAQEAGTW